MTINIDMPITISIGLFSMGTLGLVAYVLKEPDKFEKVIRLASKIFRFCSTRAELCYVKYDIQSKLNGFIRKVQKNVPNLSQTKVRLEWIDENMTQEQFLKSGTLVLRLHNSRNPNRNLVNATVAFVSYSLLIKAKHYLANYQKTTINLFASQKILVKENPEAVGELIDSYLRDAMDNKKINSLYTQFTHIDMAGLFFPIYINELNFLGEKIFGTSVDKKSIYTEVNNLAGFLNNYSNRRLSQDIISEFTGSHCKFAIRIVGKQYKVDREGSRIYVNNICKLQNSVESIYLLGDLRNRSFIDSVVDECLQTIPYRIYNRKKYRARLKDHEGIPFESDSYLVILRSNLVEPFHEK